MPLKGRSQKGIFPIITGTENVHNVPPYNTESHQPLYLEEIFTQKTSKDWEGFNSQIKA